MATIDYKQKIIDYMNSSEVDTLYKSMLNNLFPELKESEDDRIRKAIHIYLDWLDGRNKDYHPKGVYTIKDMIDWIEKQATPQVRTGIEWVNTIDDACDERYAEEYSHGEYCHEQSFKWGFQEGVEWLEKQGQVKESIISQHENKMCKENDEPLTSEDERIRKELIEQVVYIVPNDDEVDSEGNFLPIYQKRIDKYRAWLEKQGEHANFRNKIEIGDKVTRNEDGVLVNLSQLNRVAKKQGKQETLCDKCRKEQPSHSCQDITALGRCAVEHKQKPAEFDDANAKRMFIKALERVEEQNNKGYKLTDCDKNSWWEDFKTYCCYIEIQKPAWSEEDENRINRLIAYFEDKESFTAEDDVVYANWLKSLRPHNTWKPSEEQLEAVSNATALNEEQGAALFSLYQDLKELKD